MFTKKMIRLLSLQFLSIILSLRLIAEQPEDFTHVGYGQGEDVDFSYCKQEDKDIAKNKKRCEEPRCREVCENQEREGSALSLFPAHLAGEAEPSALATPAAASTTAPLATAPTSAPAATGNPGNNTPTQAQIFEVAQRYDRTEDYAALKDLAAHYPTEIRNGYNSGALPLTDIAHNNLNYVSGLGALYSPTMSPATHQGLYPNAPK